MERRNEKQSRKIFGSFAEIHYRVGRNTEMGYRVFARVEQESGSFESPGKDINQDVVDRCRQEYADFKVGTWSGDKSWYLPDRSAFTYSGNSANGNFTFAKLNKGDYSFAIIKQALYDGLECLQTEIRKLSGLENTDLYITSGYRNPIDNRNEGGEHDSRHQWGDGADIRWFDLNGDAVIDDQDFDDLNDLACNMCGAGYTEPKGKAKDHYHVDWR